MALLEPELYFVDGQQKDEVFEYGSFLQSKMFQAGVTCSHCHDPHSGTLRAQGNALCSQCHLPATFDTSAHHSHPARTTGSQCINCHMPARDYMRIDARRDHRFLIPRPDLAQPLEVPDVCTGCHHERTPAWAARQIEQWHPRHERPAHVAQALHAGRRWLPDAPKQLEQLVVAGVQPGIVRATALQLLTRYPGQRLNRAIEMAAADPDPVLRQAAAAALSALSTAQAIILARQLLNDPVLTVRVQAAQLALEWPPAVTGQLDASRWQQALDELDAGLQTQRYHAPALLGLAALARHRGEANAEDALLREAVGRQPHYAPGWISLSEFLRQKGQSGEADTLLRSALARTPDVAELQYAMALSEVRAGKMEHALLALEHAVRLAPDEPHYVYTQAIALHASGRPEQALHLLEAASQRFPGHPGLLMLLAQYAAQAQHRQLVQQAISQLRAVDPEEPALRRFYED